MSSIWSEYATDRDNEWDMWDVPEPDEPDWEYCACCGWLDPGSQAHEENCRCTRP